MSQSNAVPTFICFTSLAELPSLRPSSRPVRGNAPDANGAGAAAAQRQDQGSAR